MDDSAIQLTGDELEAVRQDREAEQWLAEEMTLEGVTPALARPRGIKSPTRRSTSLWSSRSAASRCTLQSIRSRPGPEATRRNDRHRLRRRLHDGGGTARGFRHPTSGCDADVCREGDRRHGGRRRLRSRESWGTRSPYPWDTAIGVHRSKVVRTPGRADRAIAAEHPRRVEWGRFRSSRFPDIQSRGLILRHRGPFRGDAGYQG